MLGVAQLIEPHSGRCCRKKYVPKIAGHRRGKHSDLIAMERLISIKTYDIFGDIEIGRVYESSCLTLVQYDERGDLTSGMFLCNYPNVPSVTPEGWLHWLKKHYGIEDITERGTMFIHCLVWDERYADEFFEPLLTALFEMDVYITHVTLVLPPQLKPENAFTDQMIRIVPIGFRDAYTVQALYACTRYNFFPRLKIRRAVEEDNDDIIPIIDADSSYVKEFYGEYYVSEMTRYPDGCRQLIVSEDANGFATGVMCLNSTIDVDILNENFELAVYGGLRKSCEDDQNCTRLRQSVSEVLTATFTDSSPDTGRSTDERKLDTIGPDEDDKERLSSSVILGDDAIRKASTKSVQFAEMPIITLDKVERSKDVQIEEIYSRQESFNKEGKRVRISDVVYDDSGPLRVDEESRERNEIRRSSPKTSVRSDYSYGDSMDSSIYDDSLKSIKSLEGNWMYGGLPGLNDLNNSIVGIDTTFEIPRIMLTTTTKLFDSDLYNWMQGIWSATVYHGEVNAFVIEIFAQREDIGNCGTREFLEAAFESFPDLDYCVLLLPPAYSYFPFLEHFTRVPLRCNKDFPMSLYLAHKAVLFGDVKSRKADRTDRLAIEHFISDIPKSKDIMKDFKRTMKRYVKNLSSYIFECDGVVIGLAIVRSGEDHEEIRMQYRVDDFTSYQFIRHDTHGRILHFVLMPIFSVHQKFFFREIMRLSDLTVLYYRLYEEEARSLTRTRPIISCLHAMVPVDPYERLEYHFCPCLKKDPGKDKLKVEKRKKEFSLFMSTPRIATITNRIIESKIVVVGASDCGLAFLEFLALGYPQHFIHFTNLTLISPNGLPYEKRRDDLKWDLIPFRGRYCRDYRRHFIAGRAWINVVCGTVVAINRNDKYVTVMNQGTLSYDFLILTCGLQYQKTLFREKRMDIRERGDVAKPETISNCLTVNDDTEASISLLKIRSMTNDFTEKKAIVFYGHNIDCYCALQGLMKYGLEGSWITLIEPKLNRCIAHDSVFFHNCEVDTTITKSILENEVNVLWGWNVIDWTFENCQGDRKVITSIVIRSGTTVKTVPCDIFFNFYEKEIDTNSFLAICRAGLVFDGRLIINPEFRTNDPFVFAAGTVTKYSRKFHGESFEHKYYSSIEIGEKFGKIIRRLVDVYQENKGKLIDLDRSKSNMLLLTFQSPIIVSCILPGDYCYLYVGRPGLKLARDVLIRQDLYGDVMITGTCTSEIGYFRLRLNARDTVESVTCCSKKSFELRNVVPLYGKHDSMLNEVKYRFKQSLISDFYAYFREPWALALFHDKFECLRVENRATLLSKLNCHADSLLEDCVRASLKTEDGKILEKDRELITKKYVGSVYQQEIENSVVDFLQFSEKDLPVYCTPRLMRWMYADIESSPLYFEQ